MTPSSSTNSNSAEPDRNSCLPMNDVMISASAFSFISAARKPRLAPPPERMGTAARTEGASPGSATVSPNAKLGKVQPDEHDPDRIQRMQQTIKTLERRLYHFESGPSGNGPAGAAIANATGCSSVYASTFPFNPYTDPWVNSLFQDSAPVAKGIFEGLCASAVEDFAALRTAKLDLEDHYNPELHDPFFRYFGWHQFSEEELALLPAVISMGGDGATYDIGFGALSRLLVTETPIKVVVLNTGAYSNTGG